MKSFLISWLFLLLAIGTARSTVAERFRKDINPALLYWQAFGEWPSLSEEESTFLNTNDWRTRALDERFNQLMKRYDNSYKLIRRAAKSEVPCVWGYDLTDGPDALLPGLAKAKAAAQTARLRILWHAQNGDQAAARDELVSTFVLGRNVSKDGILISALVQIAMENTITAAIAENCDKLSPATLKEILAGIDSSPPRGTIAKCIPAERFSFPGWLLRRLEDLQSSSTTEEQVLKQYRDKVLSVFSEANESDRKIDPDFGDKVIKASGGTVAGLTRYIKQLDALYDEAEVVMTRPYQEFVPEMKKFSEKIKSHPNLLVSIFFPVFEKCRNKEFAAELTLAMLRAGIEYHVSGETALKRAIDPVLKEPLGFQRFQFEGQDRGFILRSKLKVRDFDEALIFVEKPGSSFQVIGKNVGKPVQ